MKKLACLSIVLPLFILIIQPSGILYADSDDSGDTSSPLDVGLIFNIDGISLDFEEYQGGFGVKLGKDPLAFRILLDLSVSIGTDRPFITLDVGTSFEYHLIKGPLSPYFGGFLSLGYWSRKIETATDTWILTRTFPISFGPLFGIEIFPADFLSIFLEYALEFEYSLISTETSVPGSVTLVRTDEFTINTDLGNSAKLGIIIYFIRSK